MIIIIIIVTFGTPAEIWSVVSRLYDALKPPFS